MTGETYVRKGNPMLSKGKSSGKKIYNFKRVSLTNQLINGRPKTYEKP
jgi:hypothetical protein